MLVHYYNYYLCHYLFKLILLFRLIHCNLCKLCKFTLVCLFSEWRNGSKTLTKWCMSLMIWFIRTKYLVTILLKIWVSVCNTGQSDYGGSWTCFAWWSCGVTMTILIKVQHALQPNFHQCFSLNLLPEAQSCSISGHICPAVTDQRHSLSRFCASLHCQSCPSSGLEKTNKLQFWHQPIM